MNRIKKIEYAFGLLIGVAAFFLVIPYSVLFPSNIGWLGIAEDTRTYFLGWDFYRHSPWQLPISANPRYGMEISGSIFMTDTIPLIAIPLKAFNSFLPIVFQYHGIWLGVCFALQGLMAWQISSLLTSSKFNRALITDSLFARERLGSTGLGHGVAIPHGRIKGLKQPMAAMFQLLNPIGFDSPDEKPVSLMIFLLVPEAATQKHLEILSEIAELLSDAELRDSLQAAPEADSLHQLVASWQSAHASQ